ncbi:MAG TPA: M23 family metallopeptidase [Spirochaetota bacterium]|nr:M23 family metallopeptidase [Spirochaetota bacterium]HPJ33733.1 M23 family metallopeptidase [Spirochaetota bacterium]
MAINPFRDTDLKDLQQNIRQFLTDHFSGIKEKIGTSWKNFREKGRERVTVMFIPHSEKKIINFHISIFTISAIISAVVITVIITSVLIIRHSSTVKEVSILQKDGADSKTQIKIYKEEINKLHEIFQKFKPEITYLYSLTPDSNIDSLWAKGGVHNPNPDPNSQDSTGEEGAPSMELLNIQEVRQELETTKDIVTKIKKFLNYRKKIIENTPSVWPVDGYIVSRFGYRNSPYTFETEFNHGIDIEAFPGSEIRATAPGNITEIKWDPNLGLTVSVRHKYGFITSYSHCQRVSVEPGQKVLKGEVIGYVGRTGKTTEYVCFYQVKIGTEFVDPMPYLNRISR